MIYSINTHPLNQAIRFTRQWESDPKVLEVLYNEAESRRLIWSRSYCHFMCEALSIAMFDTSVHLSIPVALMLLQSCLFVEEDSLFGLKTREALTNYNNAFTAVRLVQTRIDYLRVHSDRKDFDREIQLIRTIYNSYYNAFSEKFHEVVVNAKIAADSLQHIIDECTI